MLTYSQRALRALVFLFRPYNDIDVYVEDTVSRNMYEVLLGRMLGGRARVSRVFQLGCRQSVIDECTRVQGMLVRPSLFLIDGDFEFVRDDPAPTLQHLHRLNVYCSENLLVCGNAVSEVAYEQMPNASREDSTARVAFSHWLASVERALSGLFVVYAVASQVMPALQTSGFHVYQLCEQHERAPLLHLGKVRAHRRQILALLETVLTRDEVARRVSVVRRGLTSRKLRGLHVVSGKTYLLPLLVAHLRRAVSYQGIPEVLKVQLARNCDLTIDPQLMDAVLMASRN